MASIFRADCTVLSSFDKAISELDAASLALSLERNAHIAINKFPDEILSLIFVTLRAILSKSVYDKKSARFSWAPIIAVCHHWRQIALRTPELWSHISLYDRDFAFDMAKRSGSLPLRVDYPLEYYTEVEPLAAAASSLRSFNERLEEVNITYQGGGFPPRLETLIDALFAKKPLPSRLRHLKIADIAIGFYYPVYGLILETFALESLPHLCSLELTEVLIPLRLPLALPHLTRIQVSCKFLRIPLTWLTQLLANTPNLEYLNASNLTEANSNATRLNTTAASLPKLRELHLETRSVQSLIIFHNCVSLPDTLQETHLEISEGNLEDGDEPFSVSDFDPICRRFRDSNPFPVRDLYLEFDVRKSFIVFACPDSTSSTTFSFQIPCVPGGEVSCLELCSHLPTQDVIALTIVSPMSHTASAGIPTTYSYFPNVSQLAIMSCMEESLSPLSMDSTSSDKPSLLPNLRSIAISMCDFCDSHLQATAFYMKLIDLLRGRKRMSAPVQKMEIGDCTITSDQVNCLAEFVAVMRWDGNLKRSQEGPSNT